MESETLNRTDAHETEPVSGAPSRRTFGVKGITCGSCVRRVEEALLKAPGVTGARVGLSGRKVDVTYDARLASFATMQEAVRAAGYELNEFQAAGSTDKRLSALWQRIPGRPVAAGIVAAAALTGVYLLTVGLVQGLDHALELMTGDWYFVIPIVTGFGAQIGLLVYARTRLRGRPGTGATKVLGGAGTGTSTVSMVACCAHHLTDLLPVIGISGAALFLNEYRGPLMALGILSNAAGIVLMVRMIRKSIQCRPAARPLLPDVMN